MRRIPIFRGEIDGVGGNPERGAPDFVTAIVSRLEKHVAVLDFPYGDCGVCAGTNLNDIAAYSSNCGLGSGIQNVETCDFHEGSREEAAAGLVQRRGERIEGRRGIVFSKGTGTAAYKRCFLS